MGKVLKPGIDPNWAGEGMKLLASIRNRDAHVYTENVRRSHFRVVADLFVPAINGILASLEPGELNAHRGGER